MPGLNLDDFSSGLFAGFIDRRSGDRLNLASTSAPASGVNRCNCPLDQDEKQFQFVSNTTKFYGNHTFKFGVDVRRAYNLRVPSRPASFGRADLRQDRTREATASAEAADSGWRPSCSAT